MLYKTWLELRWLFLAALLVGPLLVVRVGISGGVPGSALLGQAGAVVVPQERIAVTGRPADGRALYLQRRVLRSDLYHWTLLLGLLAGAGGLGAERGRGAAAFTASLPYRRRRLVLARFFAALGVVGVGAIAAAATMIILSTGSGDGIAMGIAVRLAAGMFTGGTVAVTTSFAFTNLIGKLTAGLALAVVTLGAIEVTGTPWVRDALFGVTGGNWLPDGGGFPVLAAAGLLAIAASGALLVVFMVDRMDF